MPQPNLRRFLITLTMGLTVAGFASSEPLDSRGIAAIWSGSPTGPVREFQGTAFHLGDGWFATAAHVFENIPAAFRGNFHVVLAAKEGIQNSISVHSVETCDEILDICFFRVDSANALVRDDDFAEPFEPICALPGDPELTVATYGFSGEVNTGLKRIEDGYGIQSRFADFVSQTGRSYKDVIVTGAPTSPGLSGSPVLITGTRKAIGVHTGFSDDTNNQIVTPFYNLNGIVRIAGEVILNCAEHTENEIQPVLFNSEVENLKKEISDIITDINKTLNMKESELFPAFENFLLNPTETNWRAVQLSSGKILVQLSVGLEKIYEYDSHILNVDTEVLLISGGMVQLVDRRYLNPFSEAQRQWNGRAFITQKIIVTKAIPTVSEAQAWRRELLRLHEGLRAELIKLLQFLDKA